MHCKINLTCLIAFKLLEHELVEVLNNNNTEINKSIS